jgi:hypothetical protein
MVDRALFQSMIHIAGAQPLLLCRLTKLRPAVQVFATGIADPFVANIFWKDEGQLKESLWQRCTFFLE